MSAAITAGLGAVIGSAGAAKLLRHGDRTAGETSGFGSTPRIPWRVIGGFELALGLALVALRSRVPLLVAVGFLVAATAYLAVRLTGLDRGACECWGPRRVGRSRTTRSTVVREALRPTWYFARNGALVLAAATALEWPATGTTAIVATVWLLVMTGTLASVLRLREQAVPWGRALHRTD